MSIGLHWKRIIGVSWPLPSVPSFLLLIFNMYIFTVTHCDHEYNSSDSPSESLNLRVVLRDSPPKHKGKTEGSYESLNKRSGFKQLTFVVSVSVSEESGHNIAEASASASHKMQSGCQLGPWCHLRLNWGRTCFQVHRLLATFRFSWVVRLEGFGFC